MEDRKRALSDAHRSSQEQETALIELDTIGRRKAELERKKRELEDRRRGLITKVTDEEVQEQENINRVSTSTTATTAMNYPSIYLPFFQSLWMY